MVKKIFLMVVLLAATAMTVLFGDGFKFPFDDPTATLTIIETTAVSTTEVVEFTATASPTVTDEPTATEEWTNTPVSTETPEDTATATSTSIPTETAVNTSTSTMTPSPTAEVITDRFSIQTGSPVFISNFAHPSQGCAWQGVAGQVFSKTDQPLTNYIVKISGTFNGKSINMIGLTGLVTNTPYGPGSFEFVLGSTALDSQDKLNLQLFDPDGVEITKMITIDTFAACTKNLEIINFKEN